MSRRKRYVITVLALEKWADADDFDEAVEKFNEKNRGMLRARIVSKR